MDYYLLLLSDKINDLHTSARSYWSILKSLSNGKKIPLMPANLINNSLISNFKQKGNHFNSIYASQCTRVLNGRTLPLVTTPVTNAGLPSISFKDQDVVNPFSKRKIEKLDF